MFASLLTLLLLCAVAESPPAPGGTIQGVVLNGTRGNEPLADVSVILRAGHDAALAPIAETRSDVSGKFVFEHLPLDSSITYLPGAAGDGVHYPGDRIRLGINNNSAQARIVAYDAVESPSPLIAEKHEIEINLRHNLMEVNETLVVSNPSHTTYIGEQVKEEPRATLQLSIPPNFDRVTFATEFYGRRFRIADHRPVTDIPWPPGRRELKFTYRVPLEQSSGMLRRTVDLPCSDVRIRVRGENAKHVSCNLSRSADLIDGVEFATNEKHLPTGFTIELEIGKMPIPWMRYARWSSVGVLCLLTIGTITIHRQRARGHLTARPRGELLRLARTTEA